jgi:hypothetical protein
MVWGMDRPTGLGEYFPDGQFESGRWNGRMMGHFHKQPPDVQKALFDTPLEPLDAMQFYAGFVVDKFRCEWGMRTSPRPEHPPLTPILDHELPTSFDTVKSYKTMASFISLNDRIAVVDAEFMELLETFEPGVHKFYPIEIRMPKNQAFLEPYHILVIGQYFDSFMPEKSKDEPVSELPNSGGKLHVKSGPKNRLPDLAFAQGVHGSAHLWRERRFGERLTCLSDALVAEIQKAGLRTPKMFKMIAG